MGQPYALAEVYTTFTAGECEANAKLMAAAPGLAMALHQIATGASVAHDGLSYSEIAEIASKALAKAGL
jgi:hypothetical protein